MTALVAVGAAAKTWLALLAMMAVQGTLLALVAVALTRTSRLRPAWQAALWLVVLAKLAVPWTPALPWSLADWIARLFDHGAAAPAYVGPPLLAPAPPVAAAWPAVGWIALASLWLVGATFVIVRAVLRHRGAARLARTAAPAPLAATDRLHALAARLRVRPPALAVGDRATGPHVVGIVRPSIIVPPALLDQPQLLDAALLHELAHVRRRDAAARILQIVARALLFWWPVVGIVTRRLEAAREAACDAVALEASELPRTAYARLLVQMAALRAPAPALAAPHALDARIAAVLGPPVRARLSIVHRAALAVFALLALGGARTAAARGAPVCHYTPQLGEQLYLAHPEADLDGDGTLSRHEACELQLELKKHPEAQVSEMDPALSEPLCCNCDRSEAYSTASSASCQSEE